MSDVSILGAGTVIKISTATASALTPVPTDLVDLSCLGREFSISGGTAEEIDTTALCVKAKTFKLGLPDAGSISFSGHFKIGNDAHDALDVAAKDRKTRYLQATYSDGSKSECLVMVSQKSSRAAVSGTVSASYTMRITGEVKETEAVVTP